MIPGQGGEGVTVYELEQGLQLIRWVKWGSLQGFEQRTDITSLNFHRLLKELCTHTHMLSHTHECSHCRAESYYSLSFIALSLLK